MEASQRPSSGLSTIAIPSPLRVSVKHGLGGATYTFLQRAAGGQEENGLGSHDAPLIGERRNARARRDGGWPMSAPG